MHPTELRAIQAPLKARYRENPAAAHVVSIATARLHPATMSVGVQARDGDIEAGFHESTGGDGTLRCSGDMLLEALVACAGVTLQAVATAMGIALRGGSIRAEGEWDARGTLGVSREVPVGVTAIRLLVTLDADVTDEQRRKLLELTERYCVVAQTLKAGVAVQIEGWSGKSEVRSEN
jgi:uncharacterized OsmC-like protein